MDIPANEQKHLKGSKPKETWFIERTGDGFVFPCEETEAWELLNNPSRWRRRDFKILGVSDGQLYLKTIKDAKKNTVELIEKKQELEVMLKKFRQTEERFIFEEMLEDDDPKVIKVREKLSEIDGKLQPLDDKIKKMQSQITKVAMDAELEKARGSIKRPQRPDVATPGSTGDKRDKILNLMG